MLQKIDIFNHAGSQYIERVSISYLSCSEVQIECKFKERIYGASCVLVYREYGNKTLVVKEYPQHTHFPLSLDDDQGNYTFTIFGKRGSDIDQRQFFETRVRIRRTTTLRPKSTSGRYSITKCALMC